MDVAGDLQPAIQKYGNLQKVVFALPVVESMCDISNNESCYKIDLFSVANATAICKVAPDAAAVQRCRQLELPGGPAC